MTEELKTTEKTELAVSTPTWHETLADLGVGAASFSFFFVVVLDALVQVLTTGNLVVRDWEITCWTGFLTLAAGSKIHQKISKE